MSHPKGGEGASSLIGMATDKVGNSSNVQGAHEPREVGQRGTLN